MRAITSGSNTSPRGSSWRFSRCCTRKRNSLSSVDAASSTRMAAYVQDEWKLSTHWAAHAGLRWEGIETQGDNGGGDNDNEDDGDDNDNGGGRRWAQTPTTIN